MSQNLMSRWKQQYVFFLARRLPACDELLPLMSQQLDRKLPWSQRIKLRLHNHICDWCKRYANQLLLIRKAMRDQQAESLSDARLSSEARDRLKRFLDNQNDNS